MQAASAVRKTPSYPSRRSISAIAARAKLSIVTGATSCSVGIPERGDIRTLHLTTWEVPVDFSRIVRRSLRRLNHDKIKQVLIRSVRTCSACGAGAPNLHPLLWAKPLNLLHSRLAVCRTPCTSGSRRQMSTEDRYYPSDTHRINAHHLTPAEKQAERESTP